MSADDAPDLLGGLERDGVITATNRAMIERYRLAWQVSAYHALLATRILTEAELATALALAYGLPRLYLVRTLTLATEAISVLGFRRAREWECLPLRADHGGIELALADPTQRSRLDSIRFDLLKQGLNCEIALAVGERSDIVIAIDELYPLSAQLPSLYRQKRSASPP